MADMSKTPNDGHSIASSEKHVRDTTPTTLSEEEDGDYPSQAKTFVIITSIMFVTLLIALVSSQTTSSTIVS
jgi:hypothetical protein